MRSNQTGKNLLLLIVGVPVAFWGWSMVAAVIMEAFRVIFGS